MTDDEQLRDPFALGLAATREAARQIREGQPIEPIPGWEDWYAKLGDWCDELLDMLIGGRAVGKVPLAITLTGSMLSECAVAAGSPVPVNALFHLPITTGASLGVLWAGK
jgi:hypothetical protein